MQRARPPANGSEYSIELGMYIDVLRRRWLLIVICLAFVTASAATYSFTRSAVYTATSEVLVKPTTTSQAYRPDQLVSLDTEARLATSAPTAELAKDFLGTPLDIHTLLKHVSVRGATDTLVLEISFWASDPVVGASGAQAFARAYLQHRRETAEAGLSGQRSALQDAIDDTVEERDRQSEILEQAEEGTPEFTNAQGQRDTLNQQITILTAQLAQIPVTVDPGEVILPAVVPTSPSSPNHMVNLALGVFLGAMLGIVLAFIRDRMDDRIRSRNDLELTVGAPVLAEIPRVHGWHHRGQAWLSTEVEPHSPAAEAYRTLRTALAAMSRMRPMNVIAVVGATLGEGKSATSANLASALAQAQHRVVVVSADLRRPRLHEFFDGNGRPGLSDLLVGDATLSEVLQPHGSEVAVIAGGMIYPNPAELLESAAMGEVVRNLRERFDFVIIDTPPLFGLADTLAVVPLADAVLLVAQSGKSKRSILEQAEEQLKQVGARIDGAVLTNVVIRRREAYRYGYADPASTRRGSRWARARTLEPGGQRTKPTGRVTSPGDSEESGRRQTQAGRPAPQGRIAEVESEDGAPTPSTGRRRRGSLNRSGSVGQ